MIVKAEFTSASMLAADTGDNWLGMPIAFSIPGSPQALITFPEDWDRNRITEFMQAAQERGDVVDWRFEYTNYSPLGWPVFKPSSEPLFAAGDTFDLHGLSPGLRMLGDYGAGQIIAVCDTGVDSRHTAFAGVEVFGDGKDRDTHGHGTHVASTAASLMGIASRAKIYAGHALPLPGGNGSELTVAQSIRDAADAGAKVINLSLGGGNSQVIDAACEYAETRGAIVVAAAGNGGGAAIGSPARSATLIVMAHDRGRNWTGFTDGRGWTNTNRVGWNGHQIRAAQANTQSGSVEMSGTSMATPHCAGALALLLAFGHSAEDALAYVLGHRLNPPDGPGSCVYDVLGPVEPPAPPEEIDIPALAGRITDAQLDELVITKWGPVRHLPFGFEGGHVWPLVIERP